MESALLWSILFMNDLLELEVVTSPVRYVDVWAALYTNK